MCGLVGMCGDLSSADKEVMRTLLILSTLRGEDSSGVAVVPKKSAEASVLKAVGSPFELFALSRFESTLSLYDKRVVIGHTRKATVGGISKYTAHPFVSDHLVGVHNGTLTNWRTLPGDTLATDSMTLFAAMARGGVRETIEATEGAYALVWWNEEDATLNFLRNNQRSLYYAFSEDFKKMFWASEPWMLNVAVGRKMKLADLSAKGDDPCYTAPFEEDTWFRVKVGEGKDPIVFLPPQGEELKGGVKKPVVFSPPFRPPYRSPFHWEADAEGDELNDPLPPRLLPAPTQTADGVMTTIGRTVNSTNSGRTSQHSHREKRTLTLVADNKNDSSEQSAVFSDEVEGFQGKPLTKAEFEKTDQECAFCGSNVDYEDARTGGIDRFISEYSFICTGCTSQRQGVC